jgi:parallel beta-helix repeat protein
MTRARSRAALALLLLAATATLGSNCGRTEFPDYEVVTLADTPDLEDQTRAALRLAKPGTVIELPPGRHEFRDELTIQTSHITLRGHGMGKDATRDTILDFSKQRAGAQGILASADQFAVQDLALENAKGDGIRVEGANGVIVEQVRVEWTNGPATSNGAYGVYPVGCRNVLIRRNVVKGASDAGIYVGQSHDIRVQQNEVQFNVAGIEIENSQDADVFFNVATNNTGGILVFDLPGNPVKGMRSRVFLNFVHHSNTETSRRRGTSSPVCPLAPP